VEDVPPRKNPLSVRLLGAGVRSARTVTKATGIDRAVETAAEDAMVAAIESEAVERALARVLQGPVVENAVHGALDSETVKRALVDALDSEMVDEVWRRLLASDEAQKLVERIAEAPEIRAAISAQSVGLIQDVGNTVSATAHRVDNGVERVGRRAFFRKPRSVPTNHAGALSRALAFAIDGLIVNLAFSGLAALAALIAAAFSGNGDGMPALTIAAGSFAWFGIGALYLVGFWTLTGKTPGMHFLDIRIGPEGERLSLGRAIKRLFGLALAIIPFGIGLLGIALRDDRRGWHDRIAHTDVLYEPEERHAAPWSKLGPEPEEQVEAPAAAAPAGTAARTWGTQRVEPSGPSTSL